MTVRSPRRGTVSALISVTLHTVVLIALAATSIRLVTEDRNVVPLVIREPAPPPPPPGPGTAAVAPAIVAPQEPPRPVQPARPEAPKKVDRPKIAAKPKAKPEVAHPQPTPAAEVAAASVVAGPAAGGVVGGVRGGEVGGQVGGRLGGAGDTVWSADQVAVPPRVVEAVRPNYPPIARARGQEAVVIVQAIIDRRGGVESGGLHVVESRPPFDDAALQAFRQWKFKPGRDDRGEVVRVLVEQPIRFQLR
jgi:periplasmic protein TonB